MGKKTKIERKTRTKRERAVKNVQEILKRMVISSTRKTEVEVVIRTRPKIATDMEMIKTKKRIRELTRIEKMIRTENTIKTRKSRKIQIEIERESAMLTTTSTVRKSAIEKRTKKKQRKRMLNVRKLVWKRKLSERKRVQKRKQS